MRGIRSTLAAVAAAGVLALAACGGGTSSSTSAGGGGDGTVRIALNNTTDALPVVVADQQGFFSAHGIKAATTTLNDVTLIPSLLGKQYDIGFSVAPILIRASAAGVPIVALSGNNGDSPQDQSVQVFTKPGITEPGQLRGKRIGAPTLTGNLNIATQAWLSKAGVDPASVQFVQVATPNMLDQLKAGQVDAVELIYPFISLAQQAGMHSLGDPERALSPNYLGGTYWTGTRSWATANPQLVENFRAALQQADQWIKGNPDQAYQIAASYTKVPLEQAKLAPLGDYTTDVNPDDLRIWGDAMKRFGGFGGNVDPSRLVLSNGK